MKPLLIIFASGVLLTAGDIFMKSWVVDRKSWLYAVGLVVYFVGLNFLAWSYLFRNIAVATALVNVMNIVTLTIVSWLFFKDKITLQEGTGLVLAVVAVILLEYKGL